MATLRSQSCTKLILSIIKNKVKLSALVAEKNTKSDQPGSNVALPLSQNRFIANMLPFNNALIALLITIATGFQTFTFANVRTLERDIEWREPELFHVDDSLALKKLNFRGAFYADTLAAIPVYSYITQDRTPLFNHQFQLTQTSFEPVCEQADRILRKAGFLQDSITLHHSLRGHRKEYQSVVEFYPFIYDEENNGFKKLVSFRLEYQEVYDQNQRQAPANEFADNSLLTKGDWYKLCVDETGIYQLGYDDLQTLGMKPAELQIQDISLFGNGSGMLPEANSAPFIDDLKENAIYVSGGNSGTFGPDDYILFYGRSPDTWHYNEATGLFEPQVHLYANEACYFITADHGQGKRITVTNNPGEEADHTVDTFHDYALHQRNLTNLLESGRKWFGEVFSVNQSHLVSFDLPNLTPGSEVTVSTGVAARSAMTSYFTLASGGNEATLTVNSVPTDTHSAAYARSGEGAFVFPAGESPLDITLTYASPASGARGWLDYIAVNVTRDLQFTGGQMPFRQTSFTQTAGNIAYQLSSSTPDVHVWEVTDRFQATVPEVSVQDDLHTWICPGDKLREFIAFDEQSYLSPQLKGAVPNQNLHGMQAKDLLIVTPEKLKPEAERLAEYRRENDGLLVGVVTTQEVYNEFSSGAPDITAIRNLLKMFYNRANGPADIPRYLLLFGDGSFDNRDYLGHGTNLIPTYQSFRSLTYYLSGLTYTMDQYVTFLADHEGDGGYGLPDVGAGRLPVNTPEEASLLVDKIIRYDQRVPGLAPGATDPEFQGVIPNYADWRNRLVFMADDGNHNNFVRDTENLTNAIAASDENINIEKIYLDAYQQVILPGGKRYPEVNRAINEKINKGALLFNYQGHGGPRGLSDQRVLTHANLDQWNNSYNMPIFFAASCEVAPFDKADPGDQSIGVSMLLKPEGGVVANIAAARISFLGKNNTFNTHFVNSFMDSQGNKNIRMGDHFRRATVHANNNQIDRRLRSFVLLGDPSMKPAYPTYRVTTTTMPDTIRAYQQVTVEGFVTDRNGNIQHDYQGVLYPTIYDKKQDFRTLGNNSDSSPFDFSMRNSLLYKGKASIEDGAFRFSFVVPGDIAYPYGQGKISYYLDNGYADGQGAFTDFIIGGSTDDYTPDHEGPVIDLYMNDTTFVSGDHTDENPVLLALLYDKSGINLTGSMGHDIVAFLNDNTHEPIRLTRHYQADLDSYQRGRVAYPLRNLEEGAHTLTLRAWDTHNNPSSESIDFIVTHSGRFLLKDLINYPNPFADQTAFVIKHNQSFNRLHMDIEIFDIQGRLVKRLEEELFSPGFQTTPVTWDGRADDGRLLGNGVYVYRVVITNEEGEKAYQADKLVIFRE